MLWPFLYGREKPDWTSWIYYSGILEYLSHGLSRFLLKLLSCFPVQREIHDQGLNRPQDHPNPCELSGRSQLSERRQVALLSVIEEKVWQLQTKVMISLWCLHMWQCYYYGDGVIPQMTCLGPLKLLRHHPVTDQATLTEFLHLNFACSAVLPKSHFLHSLCHGRRPEIFGCPSLNFLLVPCQSQNLYLKKIKC